MKTDIIYREIKRTEALESYLQEKAGQLGSFLDHEKEAHLTIRIEEDRHRQDGRKPHFLCEFLLKTSHLKDPIKVTKDDEDFKIAVSKAADAVEAILRKNHDKRSNHDRR